VFTLEPKTLILLQGSDNFLVEQQKKLSSSTPYLASLTLGCSGKKAGLWREVTHTSCGDTTSGVWEVGSNQVFLWSQPQFLKCILSSLLDPTPKCWNSPDPKSTFIDQGLTQVLPIESPDQAIIAPSVFTEKRLRSLTSKELQRVLEIQDAVSKALGPVSVGDHPFIFKAVPASVLLHLGRVARSFPTLFQNPQSHNTGLRYQQPTVEDALKKLNTRQEEKAARAHDAEIPVHLWDDKFWRSTP
jgi:hypothetical protein